MNKIYYTISTTNIIEERNFIKVEPKNGVDVIYLSKINNEENDKFYLLSSLNKLFFETKEDARDYIYRNNRFSSVINNGKKIDTESVIDMFNSFAPSVRFDSEDEELDFERVYLNKIRETLKAKENELKDLKDEINNASAEAYNYEREGYIMRIEEIKENNGTSLVSDNYLRNVYVADAMREEIKPKKKDYEIRKKELDQQKKNPFIARIDYGKDENNLHSIYIGTSRIKGYVEDWRNKALSEVYNYSDYYSTRDDSLYGLKRVYIYDKENLKTYNDVIDYLNHENNSKNLSNNTDPFFERILEEKRNSESAHDIISTMRQNQYGIVSSNFRDNVVVDGCAGSGKTMVLYHRLSYIAYNDFDFVPENSYVLTPSNVFSRVNDPLANELQLFKTKNMSFESFINKTLKDYYLSFTNLRGIYYKGNNNYTHEYDDYLDLDKYIQFKKRLKYSNSFLKFVNSLINKLTTKHGFIEYDYFTKLDIDKKEARITSPLFTYKNPVFQEFLNIERRLDGLSKENMNAFLVQSSYGELNKLYYDNEEFINHFLSDRTMYSEYSGVNTKEVYDILKLLSNEERFKMFKDIALAYDIYKSVNAYFTENKLVSMAYDLLIEYALSSFKIKNELKGTFYFENIYRLRALEDYYGRINLDKCYMFIDEYQNYSMFELDAAINAFKEPILNLYGDLSQRIDDKGIKSLNELTENYFCHLYELNFNYRNAYEVTKYINDKLNKNIESIGIKGSAKEVRKEELNIKLNGKTALITNDYSKYNLKNYNDVKLSENVVSDKLNVLSVKDAKGLEFDTVYVDDNELNENEKYVAYTRALSNLIVIKD